MTPTQPPGLRADEREALAPKAFRIPESGTPWWQTAKDVGAWTDRNEGDVGYVHFGSTEALRVYTVKVTQQAINADRAARAALTTQPSPREVPEGFKLLRDTTHAERSWPEDASHENGCYSNECMVCLRMFVGYKRRHVCKACAIQAQQAKGGPC